MSEFRIEEHPAVLLRPRISFPYAWVGHIPFAYLAMELLRPRTFVELGTDSGNSYLAFCQAVSWLELSTRCTAVDSWEGDEHARRYGDEIYLALRARHDPQFGAFSQLLRARFEDALNQFTDGSIDLLHIDGLHTYDAVSRDFESWLPKLSDRAVVLLHDTHVREREFGVWKFLEELAQKYPTFEFIHSNGLGVVAVGTQLPEAFLDFFDAASAAPDVYRGFFEALAATLVNPEDSLPVDGTAVQNNLAAHLYYRRNEEPFDDARMISLQLPDVSGSQDLRFVLPNAAAPDYLRIDPIDLPGVFDVISMSLRDIASGQTWTVSDLPMRLGQISGNLLPSDRTDAVRFASFGEDPYMEFSIGDVIAGVAVDAQLEVVLQIHYEAVVETVQARRLLRLQAAALSDVCAAAAQNTDVRSLGRELAVERDQLRSLAEHAAARSTMLESHLDNLQAQLEQMLLGRAQIHSQLSALHEHVLQAGVESGVQATFLHNSFSQLTSRQAATHDTVAKMHAEMKQRVDELTAVMHTQAEQLQYVAERLDRMNRRTLWSWLKPDRG